VGWGCGELSATREVDQWVAGPFHRLAMLNPNITSAGFAAAHNDGCWFAVLRLDRPGEEVKAYPHAVEFRPDGATNPLAWADGEMPDPLSACDGYSAPAGLPITLEIGRCAAHRARRDRKWPAAGALRI